jgi:hypothetical protein
LVKDHQTITLKEEKEMESLDVKKQDRQNHGDEKIIQTCRRFDYGILDVVDTIPTL